jgi:hypothetical protein
MRKRNAVTTAAAVAVSAAVIALTGLTAGCGGQQSAPASAVVPAARIAPQVRAILPYYQFPGPDQGYGKLWRMETGLAAMFGNVSSLDSPQALAKAEVDFQVAVDDAQAAGHGPAMPFTADIGTAVHELAAATGAE